MDSPKSELKNLGEAIRDALDASANPGEQLRTARSALLERVAARNAAGVRPGWLRRSGRPAVRFWVALGLGALGLVGAAAAFAIWVRLPISFQVGAAGTAGRLGDVVEAEGLPVALRFSEGSAVVLGAGGRARVLSAESAGARVLLENGAVDVAIVHRRPRTHWSFEAGPFHVLVTGTKFRLDWNPKDQSLGLSTREGSVLVSGGCLAEAHAVRAGETVRWSCQSSPPNPTSTANPPTAAASAAAPGTRVALLSKPAAPGDAWRELLASGHLVEGLRAAERADFGRVCRTAGESDLLALADAARLSGHTARAVQALVALRQRFPRSPDAATAAFSLGRMAFERRAAYPEAVRWFSAYLAELPQGPLMGDAVGRLMEARQRAGDRAGARADAARYLQRFPEGPYAPEARVMLSE
ncbi:MAG TPA: tetratricopeptide repeat protein [Polyangia bacterium]|nr:tetratricopeptide repeat protein [Polyangia bacterium]